jgi:hypothetical protein
VVQLQDHAHGHICGLHKRPQPIRRAFDTGFQRAQRHIDQLLPVALDRGEQRGHISALLNERPHPWLSPGRHLLAIVQRVDVDADHVVRYLDDLFPRHGMIQRDTLLRFARELCHQSGPLGLQKRTEGRERSGWCGAAVWRVVTI